MEGQDKKKKGIINKQFHRPKFNLIKKFYSDVYGSFKWGIPSSKYRFYSHEYSHIEYDKETKNLIEVEDKVKVNWLIFERFMSNVLFKRNLIMDQNSIMVNRINQHIMSIIISPFKYKVKIKKNKREENKNSSNK